MKKKLAMLLAATMLVTLFTGCGAGGKEDKGELNLYTWDEIGRASCRERV